MCINCENPNIVPGSRVRVFDGRRYKDDKSTPLSVTMRDATVVSRYGMIPNKYGWKYPDVVDIVFDGESEVRKSHFTNGVVPI